MDVIGLMIKELRRRKYSPRTIKTYIFCLKKFLKYYKGDPKKISKKGIMEYLDKLIEKNISGSTINVNLNALKFLIVEIMHKKRFFYNIKFSKTPKKLPEMLSKEEIMSLVDAIKNEKHRLMIMLMYSAGLRVSELVHLKVRDFEFDKNFGWVRGGKGNKDRLFIIARLLKETLQEYIEKNKLDLDSWLFKGNKGDHISQKSIYVVVKKAAKRAKIGKRVHPHTLRHSFATHLIENGYDVASVQSLLGHNSSETTMVYLHMASPNMINVESPLDSLGIRYLLSENRYKKLHNETKNSGIREPKLQEFV